VPAKTKAQQRKFGAELQRRREGKKPQVPGMSTKEVEKMAHGPSDRESEEFHKGRRRKG
jgi:hypothetical protein